MRYAPESISSDSGDDMGNNMSKTPEPLLSDSSSGEDTLTALDAENPSPAIKRSSKMQTPKRPPPILKYTKSDTKLDNATDKSKRSTETANSNGATERTMAETPRQIAKDPRDDHFGTVEQKGKVNKTKAVHEPTPTKKVNAEKYVTKGGKQAKAGQDKGPRRNPPRGAGNAWSVDEDSSEEEEFEKDKTCKGKAGGINKKAGGESTNAERPDADPELEKYTNTSSLPKKGPARSHPGSVSAGRGKQGDDPKTPDPNRRDSKVGRKPPVAKGTGSRVNAPAAPSKENKPHQAAPGRAKKAELTSVPSQRPSELLEELTSTNSLDEEARNMFDHILELASNPEEWLNFLTPGDYSVVPGSASVTDFNHSSAYDMLKYLFSKVNDNAPKSDEMALHSYIKVRIKEEPETYVSHKIWEPYSILLERKNTFRNVTHKEKARWFNRLWKMIASRTPYLLDAVEDKPRNSRNVSYVLLLVLTLAPEPALGQHTRGNGARLDNHFSWYQDSILDLVKYLRQDKCPELPAWKVMEIIRRLSKKIQDGQEDIAAETDSDSEPDVLASSTAARTGAANATTHYEKQSSLGKRKTSMSKIAHMREKKRAKVGSDGRARGGSDDLD